MRTVLVVLGKALAGAAVGALAMIAVGQVVGAFAPGCTVVCQPLVAAKLGAISGAVAVFTIKGYTPG